MKTIKTNIIILILILANFTSFAQTMQKDTILANKYFEKASIFKDSEQYDSAIVYYEKASVLYEKNEMWRKYLISETKHGHCLTKLWQLDQTIATIKPAIDNFLLYNDENDTIVADVYNILGFQYYYKKNLDSALLYWKKTLKIRIEILGENHIKVADSYNNIGVIYENIDYNLALEYHFKAMKVRKKILGDKHFSVADSYLNIGTAYSANEKDSLALVFYFKALKLYKEIFGDNHSNVASCYFNIGLIYEKIYKYNVALQYFLKSLNINKLCHNENMIATIYFNIGFTYNKNNEYDLAINNFFKSLEIFIELYGKKNGYISECYSAIGSVYANKNQNNLALQYHFKALKINKEYFGENSINASMNYNNIGNIYANINENNLALRYYFKSMKIDKNYFGEENINVAKSYNNIGNIYTTINKFDLALEYLEKSLIIKKNIYGEEHLSIAYTYNNIGVVYKLQNKNNLALENNIKSLQIKKQLLGENHIDIALAYNNIGNLYLNKNKYDLALEYYLKSLLIKKDIIGERHNYTAITYNNIGLIYTKQKDYNQSLQYYQKALTSNLLNFNDSTNISSVPEIKNYLSWDELLETLKSKAEIFANQNLPEFENSQKISLLHYQACDTLINQVRQEITLQSDKLTLAETASEVYQSAISLCFKMSDDNYYKEQAFYFSEKDKTRILLDEIAEKNAMKQSGIPDSLIEKEKDLRFYVSFYKNKLAKQLDSTETEKYNEKLFATSREHEALIEQLKQDHPRFAKLKYNHEVPQITDIQSVLDTNTAIRSYTVADSLIYIFTITENNFEIDTISKNKNFNSTITAIKKLILNVGNYNDYPNLIKHTENMYNQLFPAYAKLPVGIDNLIIIPDDSLSLIPFEVLLTEKYTGNADNFSEYSFLLKKYAIQYSPSVSMYYQLQTDTKKTAEYDIVILAPIFNGNDSIIVTKSEKLEEIEQKHILRSFDEQGYLDENGYIRPLIHSETEANKIFRIFKKRISMKRLHRGANEYFVKSDTLSWYRIIHFATHATSNTDKPYLSGVTLSQDTTGGEDGFLYSNEIYGLNLNSELVCLSACETATGKVQNGEGVMDLSRAFFFAGTQNVIATLWKVDDESTADIMTDFYKKYDNKNMEFVYALQKAKLDMLKSNEYNHPFFWAPFILIGK